MREELLSLLEGTKLDQVLNQPHKASVCKELVSGTAQKLKALA